MITEDTLRRMSKRDLAATLRAGHPVDADALDGTLYRGTSLGLPRWVVSITWLKFIKTFHRDPDTHELRGWNVRVEQDGHVAPWPPMPRAGLSVTFGQYRVVDPPVPGRAGTDQGLLIDYGVSANAPMDPIRLVRDPLVAVNPGDSTLLLGWSYLELGVPVGTPSFFSLRLGGRLDHVA